MSPVHLTAFLLLGAFWGLSPSLYKLMGEAGVPVLQVVVYTGIGVGAAMGVLGRWRGLTRGVWLYGLGCAIFLNVPFALSLFIVRKVPATEYALIVSTAPFFNYLAALLTGREAAAQRRLWAVAAGFASSAVLILSREGTSAGDVSWWTPACFGVPLLYVGYNWFAARYWPKDADIMAAGASESLMSGLVAVPFMLALSPPMGAGDPPLWAYWTLAAATLMWIFERIAFFTLIRDKGSLYTIQAVYVATPAAVVFGFLIFGTGVDAWLILSLAILMIALWLNNSGRAAAA
jgi:drug/metabolite transporter (DMT)-like permease